MDVMMQMTTDDVRRLRPKFTHNLTLEEFVTLMKTSLKDRIHSELDFVVGAIELFHTIDVNGDKTLEWDEFAAYMLDAGQAKADFAGGGTSIDQKAYHPWSLGFRDPKTPMNRIRTFIQELLFLPDMNALAYFEHGADVVHLYGLHFGQNDAPRHLSTIRLHTAFQAHVVITMTYIPIRRWLVISSMLNQAKLSIWELPDAMASTHQSPMMLNRVELSSPQEQLTWIPSLHVLATASVVFPPISSRSDSYKPNQRMGHTKIYQLLLWDLATLSTIADFNHRDRIKGISALASFSTPNHRVYLVVGREDGVMSVIETESGREIQTVDAHAQGVKTISVSLELELLASAGFHSYADESTQHILIWRVTSCGRLTSEATLRDHDAAVDTLCFVDETQQLVTSDVHSVFRVYASAPRYQQVDRWQCLQVFQASLPRSHACIIVIPETSYSDAVMIATSGSSVSFFDLCVRREREEVLFAFYSCPLNVIIGVTAHRVLLWHAETGKFWKTYEYAVLPVPNSTDVKAKESDEETSLPPGVMSAACMDDRERKLLLGDDRGGIRVVNIVNGNVMKALDPHNSAITWLSYVLHAKRVLSISMDAVLHICDENNPLGYYVPFGGGPPQSVLLQSLRVHPETDTSSSNNASSTKNARYEVFKAIGNHELNLLAVLMLGPHGESFIQLWNFDLGHAQGTCIAPEQEEVACVAGS
ncbi:hypothetical protein Poli38472_013550 [Pythium oligandrum]|uniref:EF-hand domain-containing protein n=1 Tax=Pythium oligandrum TaxID=41045 RepID=A0A8K1C7Z8_PYTOL|nr:hypothetical protein Poli38472_013550 [Pythium oligandrum]|eukprot:TMW58076.1 hypothetical protein Poli38472_013550 [Pythium oligandrum]